MKKSNGYFLLGCVVAGFAFMNFISLHTASEPETPKPEQVIVYKDKIVYTEAETRFIHTPIDLPQCDAQDDYSREQWHTIERAFAYGHMHNYGYTIAAIAIVESSAGVKLENYRTMDFGVFQININTARTRLNKWNHYDFGRYDINNDDDLIELLITREDINALLAIEEIKFWHKNRDTWFSTWASYNAGYYHNTTRESRAVRYANKIHKTIKSLEECSEILKRNLK